MPGSLLTHGERRLCKCSLNTSDYNDHCSSNIQGGGGPPAVRPGRRWRCVADLVNSPLRDLGCRIPGQGQRPTGLAAAADGSVLLVPRAFNYKNGVTQRNAMTGSAPRRQSCGLPAEVASFVGRRHEVAAVRQLLSHGRLLTLTGAGGIGKTRLALHVAHGVRRAFRDGVWLADLAPLMEAKLLAQAVVDSMGIRDESGRPPETVLASYLADRSLLLVLDNCEHLIDACAELVSELLRAAPELRILATSREPLRVPGEQMFDVPPLTIPDPGKDLAEGDFLQHEQYEAVALLYERAAAAVPGFTGDGDDAEAMVRIAQRLDGLPLAIELAAVRLRVLSPKQLLQKLDDVFGALGVGRRSAEPRQRTLRSMIDWSFDPCSPAERALWAQVSVFRGSFDLEAVDAVCTTDGILGYSILDQVTGLIDKSIMIREEHPVGVRYRLLDTIRQYGLERLEESGELPMLRRRHRDYYSRLAKRRELEWFSPRQLDWFNRSRLEHPNIRVALDFCLTEPGEVAAGLRIVAWLRTYWHANGSLDEGRRWIKELLTLEPEPSPVRLKALLVDASLALLLNDVAGANQALAEVQALTKRFGDPVSHATMAHVSGLAALLSGDPSDAARLLHEALAHYRETHDAPNTLIVLFFLASAMIAMGDEEQAMTLADECLALSESLGEHWIRGWVQWTRGVVAWRQGDIQQAVRLERESIRFRQYFNDRMGIGQCVEVLAWTAAAEGESVRAARMLGEVERIWREVGGSLYSILADFHRDMEAQLRTTLGPEAFEAAWAAGTEHSYDEIVAAALGKGPPTSVGAPEADGADTALNVLTPREREIAELIAQGLSNRKIASNLVIAERTTEGHVEHIMTKLGFTSRSQIAAWLTRQTCQNGEYRG